MSKIKLAIVENQVLYRKGLISLLKEFNEFEILIDVSNGEELLEQIKFDQPDIILLDIDTSVLKGVETIMELRKLYPKIKILFLTMQDKDDLILELFGKGAHGFLLKNNNIELVVNSIHTIIEKGYCFNDRISKIMVNGLVNKKKKKFCYEESQVLTKRELEIAKLICQQLSNREIAEKLFISVRTVDGHKEKILQKTAAKNSAGIVMYAIKHQLLD